MRMVATAVDYYESEFTGIGERRRETRYPHTIFNMVVDEVVRHWVYVMVEGSEERGKRVKEGRHQNALFYTDDGMVAFSDPRWLQGAFSTLVCLFDRVGMRTNVRKTVGMVFCPCRAEGTQSEVEYGQQMTGEGPSYRE